MTARRGARVREAGTDGRGMLHVCAGCVRARVRTGCCGHCTRDCARAGGRAAVACENAEGGEVDGLDGCLLLTCENGPRR